MEKTNMHTCIGALCQCTGRCRIPHTVSLITIGFYLIVLLLTRCPGDACAKSVDRALVSEGGTAWFCDIGGGATRSLRGGRSSVLPRALVALLLVFCPACGGRGGARARPARERSDRRGHLGDGRCSQ